MDKIEECCRAICVAKGIDPDAIGHGMGRTRPEGITYKLWEYQREFVEIVDAIL